MRPTTTVRVDLHDRPETPGQGDTSGRPVTQRVVTALRIPTAVSLHPDADTARSRRADPERLAVDPEPASSAGGRVDHDEGSARDAKGTPELDAVEFCRLLSGRGEGCGLLAVEVGY